MKISVSGLLLVFSISITIFISHVSAKEPGFKSLLTDKALSFLGGASKNLLINFLKAPKNITRKMKISTVDVTISRVKFTDIDDNFKSELIFQPQVGLEHKIKNMSLTIGAQYDAKLQPSMVTGHLAIKIYKLSMSTVVRLANEKGKLKLSYETCKASIGYVELYFVDGTEADKILNQLMTTDFKMKLKTALQEELCNYAKDELIPLLAKVFMDLPTDAPLFDQFFFDYALSDEPNVQSNFLETYHVGKTYVVKPNGKDDQVDFEPHQIKYPPPDVQKMAYLFMSNYSINGLMYFLYKSGLLNYTLTREKVPKDKARYLRTDCGDNETCAGSLFPSLKAAYPKGWLEVFIVPTSAPNVVFLPGKARIVNSGFVETFVRKPDKSRSFLFSSNADLNMDIKNMVARDYSFYPQAKIADYKLTNFKSSFPDLTVESLWLMMDFAKEQYIEPDLNALLRNGLILPKIINFNMLNGTAEFFPDYVMASTDFCVDCEEGPPPALTTPKSDHDYAG